ncbi:valine--tRNA ligase, partial [Patescibacteria group bacterium]
DAPTMWCPACKTAISQVELEDKELITSFNDIPFKVINSKDEIIISTTRPELLPACVAIFYHPDDPRYKKFKNKKAKIPLFEDFPSVPIKSDKRVDKDKRRGAVMCCTFGDQQDMEWQKAHKLPIREAISSEGKMTKLAGNYEGMKIEQARSKIIEDLRETPDEKGPLMVADGNIIRGVEVHEPESHDVNVHERCGTPIEFLKSKQWFIKYLDLKDKMLEWGSELKWFPEFMKNRYDNWVKGLQWDWCISRQIYYGVPFPVWYCEGCDEVILAKEKDLPIDPLKDKPPITKCPKCQSTKFVGESDIINTWATSSLTPQIGDELAKERGLKEGVYPQNLRLQAHDIITFWVFNTVFKSQLHFKKNPFQDVLVSGWVLDPQGKKMSKSKGNVVVPEKVFDEFGVDAFRYWAAGSPPGADHNFMSDEVRVGKRTVTKLWNAGKFTFSHLEDFDPQAEPAEAEPVDQWILGQLAGYTEDITEAFEKYNYARALELTDKFFWNDFTDRYLEFVKYRLYGDDVKSKNSARQTLYTVFLAILKFYAPIVPYITEELYQAYYGESEKSASIHIAGWPKVEEGGKPSEKIIKNFGQVIELIDEIRKWKSDNDLSMGKEVPEYKAKTKIQDEYKEFVKQVMRVKELK